MSDVQQSHLELHANTGMLGTGTTADEEIYMPYSFYSQKNYEAIQDKLRQMGYVCVKLYPDDIVTVRRSP